VISWFLVQASTYAAGIDNLILLIAVIVGVWFVAAEFLLLGLILKFREREGVRTQYVAGEDKREKRWVSYPHYAVLAFDVVILYFALTVWNDIKVYEPTPQETVRIVSQQWAWTFVHAGPDGRLDTPDDIRTVDDLYLQQHRVYRFELHSKDVLHSFSVPVFRLKQDAVPGRMISGWFTPTLVGTFDIQCAEICGIGHGFMPGRVHVQTAAAHQAWQQAEAGTMPAPRAAADPAQPALVMASGQHAHAAGGNGGAQ
jgi:cytochrome c oxidase subunit 2